MLIVYGIFIFLYINTYTHGGSTFTTIHMLWKRRSIGECSTNGTSLFSLSSILSLFLHLLLSLSLSYSLTILKADVLVVVWSCLKLLEASSWRDDGCIDGWTNRRVYPACGLTIGVYIYTRRKRNVINQQTIIYMENVISEDYTDTKLLSVCVYLLILCCICSEAA